MTLEEAIEEVKRGRISTTLNPPATSTILNAVASGQLIPKADADLAVAEALRKAGELIPPGNLRQEVEALANQDHLAEVTALRADLGKGMSEAPTEPGGFIGDIYYGDPDRTTFGTHRWNGSEWMALASEAETLMMLLGSARARIADLERQLAEAQGEFRKGWRFAYNQWDRTGSVPNPDYTPDPETKGAALTRKGEPT